MKLRIRLLACLLFLLPFATQAAPVLDEVRRLAVQTPGLALHYLAATQPDPAHRPQDWMAWERLRIELYRKRGDHHAIAERLARLPAGLPVDFADWAATQRVRALLRLGKGEAALVLLRRLIWRKAPEVSSARLQQWRRLVIEAWLTRARKGDAVTALRRYRQDYRDDDPHWRLLGARVLLLAGHPREAEGLLGRARTSHEFALYFLARLRSGSLSPAQVYRRAYRLARKSRSAHVWKLWIVAAQAAGRSGQAQHAIQAWSRALKQRPRQVRSRLFAVDGRKLWQEYRRLGRRLASRYQLLDGDDRAWLRRAKRLMRRQPLAARAILAELAASTRDAGIRRKALYRFAWSLARAREHTLLIALYLQPGEAVTVDDLPAGLRRRMVDRALRRSNFRLASTLMGSLTRPPAGARKLFWQMRRARILILGGAHEQGIAAMRNILSGSGKLSRRQLDRLMQVIFDIQAIGRHRAAIELFDHMPVPQDDLQRRREILFWQADSWKALGHYQDAARYYLRSATLPGAKSMDPWAQTARYHAAEALVKAGLYDDAEAIYRHLLRVTRERSRRTVLASKLRQLRLRRMRRGLP